ncbi:MAG: hypothetical protein HYZ14_07715 [Bacteroidetes bacterium]|nr:hypothetical protein [Bacteroidota bacterium]
MQNQSKIERPYGIDVICPIGTGLRITLQNYTKEESEAFMQKLHSDRQRFHILVLIEMALRDYIIYPSDKVEEITEGRWFGVN